jgi:hypothetical protein
MSSLLRWLRGAFGMAIGWSVSAAGVILLAGISSIASGHARGPAPQYLSVGFARWVPIAFAAGFAFACLITVGGRWRGLRWLSPSRGASIGGIIGAALMVGLTPRGVASETVAWAATALIASLGALIGGGIVWMAGRALAKTALLPDGGVHESYMKAASSRTRVAR